MSVVDPRSSSRASSSARGVLPEAPRASARDRRRSRRARRPGAGAASALPAAGGAAAPAGTRERLHADVVELVRRARGIQQVRGDRGVLDERQRACRRASQRTRAGAWRRGRSAGDRRSPAPALGRHPTPRPRPDGRGRAPSMRGSGGRASPAQSTASGAPAGTRASHVGQRRGALETRDRLGADRRRSCAGSSLISRVNSISIQSPRSSAQSGSTRRNASRSNVDAAPCATEQSPARARGAPACGWRPASRGACRGTSDRFS